MRQDVTRYFIDELQRFLDIFPSKIEEYETLIDTNRIWLKRTVGVGKPSGEEVSPSDSPVPACAAQE